MPQFNILFAYSNLTFASIVGKENCALDLIHMGLKVCKGRNSADPDPRKPLEGKRVLVYMYACQVLMSDSMLTRSRVIEARGLQASRHTGEKRGLSRGPEADPWPTPAAHWPYIIRGMDHGSIVAVHKPAM